MNPKIIITILVIFMVGTPSVLAASATVDLSSNINTVHQEFYGTQLDGWGAVGSKIDANGDKVLDALSDHNAHRSALLDVGVDYLRRDMQLQGAVNADGTFRMYNVDPVTSQVEWAANNGKKILLETNFMPTWLADNSPNCVSDRTRCAPYDYALWGKIVVQYLDLVTQNGKYAHAVEIEVWNEPYQPMFLAPNGNIQDRINIYNKLYPATRNAIKAKYPNMPVGGPSGWYDTPDSKTFTDTFLTNFPPSQVDFVTFHAYNDAKLSGEIQKYVAAVRAKGHTKEIKVSEYNVYSSHIHLGNNGEYQTYLSESYIDVLNNAPEVTSMVLYKWSESTKYAHSTAYTGYPRRSAIYSEPKLDNTKYATYQLVKDFTTFHSPGSNVLKSTSGATNIKVLATKSGSDYYLTIINNNQVSTPLDITFSGASIGTIKDAKTGSSVTFGNGVANFGTIPGYSVRHYKITPTAPIPPPTPINPTYIQIQAENANAAYYPMSTADDEAASGGEFIQVPLGTNFRGGKVSYIVSIPASGNYKIMGRTIAPNTNQNSFLVSINNGAAVQWEVMQSSRWKWSDVNGAGKTANYYLAKGTHTITIHQDEAGTKLDELLVTNDLNHGPVYLGFQAEQPDTLDTPMEVQSDATAAAGNYIMVPNGASGVNGKARFLLDIPKDGNYKILGRTIAPNADDDSFLISIDGAPTFIWDVTRSTTWSWNEITQRIGGTPSPATFQLTKGQHSFSIVHREDGTKIDEVIFTTDMQYDLS